MSRSLLMLDLFCGRQGASQTMRARGWHVHAVDLLGHFSPPPDECADLTHWSWPGPRPDLIWASPPCTEFARESMPWCRTGATPSLALVEATQRIIAECQPRFFVIENVKGAVPYLGKPTMRFGPWHLWGRFPTFHAEVPFFKEKLSSTQKEERAKIPTVLAEALADAVEAALLDGPLQPDVPPVPVWLAHILHQTNGARP